MRSIAHVVTGKKMTSQFFSLVLRRVLFVLVGKSNLGNKETWFDRVLKTFGRDKSSSQIGLFYRKNVNTDLSLQKTIRHEAASTLSKALEMTKFELIDFIDACADRSPMEIQDLVENRLWTRDLVLAIDATYVRYVT